MISLDTACQAKLDANPPTTPSEDKEGTLVKIDFKSVDGAITVQSPEGTEFFSSLDTIHWIIIGCSALGFILLITLTVCAVRRGLRSK